MKFTLSWLKEHLDTTASLDAITEALTDLGLEVEGVTDPASRLKSFTIAKVIEAVRQLRGEAAPAVQVSNCDLAVVNGIGGILGLRHAAATLVLERQ